LIYGRHDIGGVTFRPPTSNEGYTAFLIAVEQVDGTPEGREIKIVDMLDRADVERLRDLCDEALS
jgi:hypothetical protein